MNDERSAAHFAAAIDPGLLARVSKHGFTAEVMNSREAFDRWIQATGRGFLDGKIPAEDRDVIWEKVNYRRRIGVLDPAGALPDIPVATFTTWPSRVSIPGGSDLPALAVSGVTVAPTHHRRGLARAMMTGELTVARDLGMPVAMLTATEAGLYQRYGFAPAAQAAMWTIDVRRAGWRGPQPDGRLDFVTPERARELLPSLHERVRPSAPGEPWMPEPHWDNITRTRADAKDAAKARAVTYTSPDGSVDGVVVYNVEHGDPEFSRGTLTVSALISATDDAYAALWGYVLQHDLMATVVASERAVDEPLWWMIADQRAAKIEVIDHQYLRLLDVPAALEARTYLADGRFALHVSDPLGFADGDFVLEVAGGTARVTRGAADDAVQVTLSATELAALYLGGVSARALRTAGRLQTDAPDAVDDTFRSRVTPRLSYWY